MSDFADASRADGRPADRGARDWTIRRCSPRCATVPREEFVSRDYGEYAYRDSSAADRKRARPFSQPYIVALTIDAAEIKPGDKVLEVGAGSGYAAAVIGQIAAEVIAIERHPNWSSWRASGWRSWAMAMSGSSKATAPWAGRRRRRYDAISPRRAEAMCPQPLDRPAEAWRADS